MTLRHYYRDLDGTLTDMSGYSPRVGIVTAHNAEEGTVGSWSVTLDDPDGTLNIVGHRNWFIEDDESEDEDDIIWGGFTGKQTIGRIVGDGRRMYGPQARTIDVELYDANSVLNRVIMKGADTDRPLETDVERIQWLFSTSEAALFDDATTFVHIGSPVAMDKAPLRGTYFGQIISDCSQQSGKNFYAWYRKVGTARELTFWYGKDGLTDYDSPFFISNDMADINQPAVDQGSAIVWPLSDDATLERNPDVQYCGNYMIFEGGATYRHNATTHSISAHRDMSTSASLVKTLPKAQARADRMLLDVQDQALRVKTTLTGIPQERVTLAKPGMRLQLKGTHWGPELDDWHYATIVTAQPRPFGPGVTWDIDLELVVGTPVEDFESPGPPADDYEGDVFAGLLRSRANAADNRGPLKYGGNYNDGSAGWNSVPTTGPITIVPGVPGLDVPSTVWDSIFVSAPMVVRLHAIAMTTGIYIPDQTVVLNVRVNGVVVGSDVSNTSVGTYEVDLRDYHLDAGDLVSIDSDGSGASGGHGPDTLFWTNFGVNGTFLMVVRGDFTAYDPSAFGP